MNELRCSFVRSFVFGRPAGSSGGGGVGGEREGSKKPTTFLSVRSWLLSVLLCSNLQEELKGGVFATFWPFAVGGRCLARLTVVGVVTAS